MKKLLLFPTVLLLSFFGSPGVFGQSVDYLQKAYTFIEETYGLDKASIGELIIKDQVRSKHNQVEHLYLAQAQDGIEIHGTSISLAFLPNGRIYSTTHRLISMDQFNVSPKKARVTPTEAIHVVAGSLGISSRAATSVIRHTPKGVPVYDKADIALQDMPVELIYSYTPTGEYKLAWKILIESGKNGNLYQSYVDATSGELIANDVLTLHCTFDHGYLAHDEACVENHAPVSTLTLGPVANPAFGQYRILPLTTESPNHGTFEMVTGFDDPIASPFGWHDTNGVDGAEYTHTQGNNVHAFLDRDWSYTSDVNVDGGAALVFDFPFNSATEPASNQNIAATNLFFWNNIMHDFTYRYGMDEAGGSFQQTNYSGFGADQDHVEAHAQFGDNNTVQCGTEANGDTECINNADFSPTPDGFNGRMRMFTWNQDVGSKYLDVLEPLQLAGKIQTGLAAFGPDLTTEPVTGEVLIVDDGTFDGSKGCNPLTQPALEGKIALIDRGLCDFSQKVYYAQEAGAIGAIICNFEDAVIGMGAAAFAVDVTIPSVFISSVECNRIRIAAGTGLVVSLVAPGTGLTTKRDGSLDNGIIAHEYGHGVSNRLTGGPNTAGCLSGNAQNAAEEANGMGEGWSDFFGLVTSVKPGDTGSKRRGIGTYAIKEEINGKGIRTFPYTTDMSVNPHTYDNVLLEGLPHGVGSVWCAMLWDMYWAFSDTYGWDPDVYGGTGGNNMAIQLVMDGMKLQPCRPGFIDARDAILKADTINNGGANACLIWGVFARRGLGFNADGGDPDSRSDGKQGFELPVACRNDLTFSKTMTPEIVAGQEITVTIQVVNYKDETLTNVFIEDPIPPGCTYLVGSANIEPNVGNSLVWPINTLAPDESLTITYLLQSDPEKNSIRMQYDDIEGDALERWDIAWDPLLTTSNFWYQEVGIGNNGTDAWRVEDVPTESEHFLQNYEAYAVSGSYPVYRFFHYYNTETGADGGFLEISTDDSQPWFPLESKIFRNGYPRKLQYTTFAIPNLSAFSGLSTADGSFVPVYIDLRDYVGEDIKIRYRFGTDDNTGGDAWYIDDVEIMDAIIYNSTACFTSDQTNPVCTEAPERGTIVDSQLTISTDNDNHPAAFAVMPNPAGNIIQVVMSAKKSDESQVTVYNLTGHLLSAEKWNLTEGLNQKVIDISRLTPGMYVMQVRTSEGMRSEKFVKE